MGFSSCAACALGPQFAQDASVGDPPEGGPSALVIPPNAVVAAVGEAGTAVGEDQGDVAAHPSEVAHAVVATVPSSVR